MPDSYLPEGRKIFTRAGLFGYVCVTPYSAVVMEPGVAVAERQERTSPLVHRKFDREFLCIFHDAADTATAVDPNPCDALHDVARNDFAPPSGALSHAAPATSEQTESSSQTCAEIDWFAEGYVNDLEPKMCITNVQPRHVEVGDLLVVSGYGFAMNTPLFAGFVRMDDIVNVDSTEIHARMPRMQTSASTCAINTLPSRGQDTVPRIQRVTLLRPTAR